MSKSKLFPKILIIKYSYDPENLPEVYHLILNDNYEGCYMTKADLLERLNLVMTGEVFKI